MPTAAPSVSATARLDLLPAACCEGSQYFSRILSTAVPITATQGVDQQAVLGGLDTGTASINFGACAPQVDPGALPVCPTTQASHLLTPNIFLELVQGPGAAGAQATLTEPYTTANVLTTGVSGPTIHTLPADFAQNNVAAPAAGQNQNTGDTTNQGPANGIALAANQGGNAATGNSGTANSGASGNSGTGGNAGTSNSGTSGNSNAPVVLGFGAAVVGGATIAAAPGGGVVAGGQTVPPGGVVTLGNGIPVSVSPDGSRVVAGGQSAQLPGAVNEPAVNVGGQAVTPVAGGVIVGGNFVGSGSAFTGPGGVVSVGPGGVVVANGATATVGGGSGPVPVTVGGAAVTPIAGSAILIGGQTIQPGQVATLANGQVVSLSPGGNTVLVNGQSAVITPAPTAGPVLGSMNVNGAQVTPIAGGVVISGTTLLPGNVATIGGNTISIPAQGGTIVVNGKTAGIAATPLVSVGGVVATPVPGGVVIDGSTLSNGQVATINGHAVTVSAGQLIVNGQTASLPASAAVVTVNGEPVELGPNGAIVVDGLTLTPGQTAVLADGHTVSVGSNGVVVVDGSTQTLVESSGSSSSGAGTSSSSSHTRSTTSSTSSSQGLGAAIASGIGVSKKAEVGKNAEIGVGLGFVLGMLGLVGLL
jgi:hypothetical protein